MPAEGLDQRPVVPELVLPARVEPLEHGGADLAEVEQDRAGVVELVGERDGDERLAAFDGLAEVLEVGLLAGMLGRLGVFVRVRAAGDHLGYPVPEAAPDVLEPLKPALVLGGVVQEPADRQSSSPPSCDPSGGHDSRG